ncbi:MAG: fibronectin type III domain-containing protein [Elusimicrobia bacterium]|nr:fibronectin type III domain-containing protein [Elusimicrobiota bacterium]
MAAWPLAVGALTLFSSPLYAAGTKSSGATKVIDDTHGLSGSVKAAAGSYSVYGGLGQIGVQQFSGGIFTAESGFFSKLVSSPTGAAYLPLSTESISAQWTHPSPANPGGFVYVFLVSTAADFTGVVFSSFTPDLTASTGTLTPNTTYFAGVLASYLDMDDSPFGALGSTATLANPPTGTIVLGVGNNSAVISWALNNNPSSTRFQIQYSTSNAFTIAVSSQTGWNLHVATGTSVYGLAQETTYYFRVWGRNHSGITTAFDVDVSTLTVDLTPPATINNLSAVQSGTPNKITLRWPAPGDDGGAGALSIGSEYRIQYATDTAFPAVGWSTANAQIVISTSGMTPGATVSETFLLPATSLYYFRIWTKDEANNWSAQSSTAAAFNSLFSFEVADGTSSAVGEWTSMAIDRDNNLHVAYRDVGNTDLLYIKRTGATWGSPVTVDSSADVGESPSIAVDMRANPHISYFNATNSDLKYAKFDGSWSVQTVDSSGLAGHQTSIAIDGMGNPHIAYFDLSNSALKYARWTGVVWSTITVDTWSGGITERPSLALDGAANAHIVYPAGPSTDLKFAKFNGTSWSTSTIDTGGSAFYSPSIAIDGSGNLHVAYTHVISNGYLKYAQYNGAVWSTSTIDADGYVGAYPSIALDGSGNPSVSYYDNSNADLKFASFSGVSWSTGTLDSNNDVGLRSCVAIDSVSAVHISYYSNTVSDLKIAHWTNTGLAVPMGGNSLSKVQAPLELGSATVTSNSINWTWRDNSTNEFGFRLYGSTNPAGSFSLIAGTLTLTASGGSGSMQGPTSVDSGLMANATYFRYIAAVNAGGVVTSSGVTVVTMATEPVAAAFTQVFTSSIQANWSANNNSSGTFYQAILSSEPSPSTNGLSANQSTVTLSASYIFTGLYANATHYVQVKAIGHNGVDSSYVSLGSTQTLAKSPAMASVPFSSPGPFSLNVDFLSAGNAPDSTYNVILSSQSSPSANGLLGNQNISTASLSAFFAGLTPNTTYFFDARTLARDGVSHSAFVNIGSTATRTASPGSFVFNPSTSSMDVSWTLPSGTAIGFRLEASSTNFTDGALYSSATTNGAATTLSVNGLNANTTYYFQVAGINWNNLDQFSAVAATATLANPPAGADASGWGSTSITVNFSTPTGGSTGFLIEGSSTNFSGTGTIFSSTTINTLATSLAIISLDPNTTYYLKAGSYNWNQKVTTVTIAPRSTNALEPPSPQVTAIYVSSVSAAWGIPTGGSTGFLLEASSTNFTDGTIVSSATSDGLATTLTITAGLNPNTTYYIRPNSRNWAGFYSPVTVPLSTITLSGLPSSLVFDFVSESSVTFSWNLNSNPPNTEFRARISTAAGVDGAGDLFTAWTVGTSSGITGLSANTTYYLGLRSRNLSAIPIESSYVTISTVTKINPPAAAQFNAVVVSSIGVSWNPNGNGPDTFYDADISSYSSFSPAKITSTTLLTSATFFTITPNTTWYFQVRSNNPSLGAVSNYINPSGSTVTLAVAPLAAATAFPSISSSAITADWLASGNPSDTRYEVQASSDGFATIMTSMTTVLPAAFSALQANTTYQIQVRAKNHADKNTSFLTIGSTSTLAAKPIVSAFTNVFASSVQANWQNAGNFPGTIYYAAISSGAFPGTSGCSGNPSGDNGFSGNLATTTINTFFLPVGLIANTTYFGMARAVNHNGVNSIFENLCSTVTLANPPVSLASTFTFVGASSVTAQWDANSNPGGTEFELQVSNDPGFGGFWGFQTTDTFRTVNPPLFGNTTYFFQVRAINYQNVGSTFTFIGSTVTLANLPSATNYFYVSESSMTISWSLNNNAADTEFSAQLSTSPAFDGAGDAFSSWFIATSTGFRNLLANTTYYARVKARNYAVTPVETLFVSLGSTVTRINPPATPIFNSVVVSSIGVSWNSNGNGPDTLYDADISSYSGFSPAKITSTTLLTSATFFSITPNTTWYFQVRANNPGVGNVSNYISPSGSTVTLAVGPVGAVSTFTMVAVSSITINWDAGANPPGTLFEAEASSDGFTTKITSLTAAVPTFNSLLSNTTYQLQVRAVNHGGVKTGYLSLGSTSTLAGLPANPYLSARGTTTLAPAWGANGNPSYTAYVFEVSTDSGFSPLAASSVTLSTFASIVSLSTNTQYFMRVKAVNSNNTATAFANLASSYTYAATPDNFVFSNVVRSSFVLTWQAAGNPSYTPYRVRVSTEIGMIPFAEPVPFAENFVTLSTAITALSQGTTYYVCVQARNVDDPGTTTGCAVVSTTTAVDLIAPAAVSNFSALTPSATGQLRFEWSAPGDDGMSDTLVGGYQIQYSSFSFAWSSAAAQVNISTFGVPPGSAVGHVVSDANLVPNTSYYTALWTRDSRPNLSALSNVATGVTLADPPGSLASPMTAVNVSSLSLSWSGSNNPANTEYFVEASSISDFSLILSSQSVFTASAAFTGLSPNHLYYFQARSRNLKGITTGSPVQVASTYTAVALPAAPSGPVFLGVFSSSITAQWSANGNGPGTTYQVTASTSTDFIGLVQNSTVVSATTATVSNLIGDSDYYLRVTAINGAGIGGSLFFNLGSTRTLVGGADSIAPVINDNQSGDNTWRSVNNGVYDIDFEDYGGSGLDKFQVRASTVPGSAGPFLTNWTDAGASLPTPFTTNWSLPNSVWNALAEGDTNYISVQAFDVAGNSTTLYAAFYVLKDTTAPVITATLANVTVAPKTYGYFNSDPGAIFDVDFNDSLSRLHTLQYSVSSTSGTAAANVLTWTNIATPPLNVQLSTNNWSLAFAGLLDGPTNYVSVRAWDVAGSTAVLIDAFIVLKDVSGPIVAVTVPTDTYRSAVSAISGTAFDYSGISNVQVSIQELGSNGYWTGSDFIGINSFWLNASGQNSWTLNTTAIPWADNTSYRVVARSTDTVGLFSVNYATVTFGFDTTKPAVSILAPANGTAISSIAVISGTASDSGSGASGPVLVDSKLRRLDDGRWWDFALDRWDVIESTARASGASTWTLTASALLQANLVHGATYYVTAAAQDAAVPANLGDFFVVASTFIFQDTTPPAAVSDLTASTPTDTPGEVQLAWTVPGDDGTQGLLINGAFKIQHSTYTQGVVWSTQTAQTTQAFTQITPGSSRTITLSSLAEKVTHYFVLWTMDSDGNWSAPSVSTPSIVPPGDPTAITGWVAQANQQGLSGIVVEAIDKDTGQTILKTLSEATGTGIYRLAGLAAGKKYRIKVTWTANNIISTVYMEDVPAGSSKINYYLGVNYGLGSISGPLALAPSVAAALKAKESAQGAVTHLQARYGALAQGQTSGEEPYIELKAGGQVVARAPVNSSSEYEIKNLLPGNYTLVGFNGHSFSEPTEVSVAEGQNVRVSLEWEVIKTESVFAFPNPAKDESTIRFIANIPTIEARIAIYDIAGNLVRELSGGDIRDSGTGIFRARWDTTNLYGDRVASGVYVFVVQVRDTTNNKNAKVVKKLAIIR